MTMVQPVEVEWEGRRISATVPPPIAALEVVLDERLVRRTEQAAAAARRVGALATGPAEVAARLLLRSEGLASSAIEGLRASAATVALAEVHAGGVDEVAGWVADNLAVVRLALDDDGPLDASRLAVWHRRLMVHAPNFDDRHRGAYRDVLGWVGGPSPLTAAHVAAPPGLIAAAMDDLFAYAARVDVDAVTQAAVLHAQFETIHPFADGNGRLGRILIGRVLARRLGLLVPPPVSQEFARDIGGYLSGLTLYRLGQPAPWVSWFATTLTAAAERSEAVLLAVSDVVGSWDAKTSALRVDSAARRLLPLLASHPVVSAQTVSNVLGVSVQAGLNALIRLAESGVLVEAERLRSGPGRPARWWVAQDLLDLLGT